MSLVLAAHASVAAPHPHARTIREDLPEAARKDWDAARDLLEANDFAGALVEYLRAYEQSKNPRVLYNVAVCDKNLRHYARAESWFKRELAEGDGKIPPAEEQAVRDAIAALEPFVTKIEVVANEAGATLYIDEQDSGLTPFVAPLPIDVGPHELRMHKDGFVDVSQSVTVTGGAPAKATFDLEPRVPKAQVTVQVSGSPGANVFMDGVDMGQAPFKGEVVAGRHTFEARAPGFVTARQTTEVVYRQPLDIALELAPERHVGRVHVETTPAGAAIAIDGRGVGSGTFDGPLPTGGHQLIVRKPGYVTFTSEITLNDDQSRDVTATLLEEKGGTSWVAWTVGTVLVVGGGAIAGYFLFKPTDQQPVVGNLDPGTVPTAVRRFGSR